MIYRTGEGRREPVSEVLAALEDCRFVVLTTHVNADGDGAGSEVAMRAWLRSRGTDVWIVNPTPFPTMYSFLLSEDSGVVDASSPRAADLCDGADMAVVLDTGEGGRIGRVKSMIDHVPKVVIDHHPPGDDPIPGVSLRDPAASATGELVFDLFAASGGPWPQEALDALYVAILTDTGSFRFGNSTPSCHRVVAELIARGADPERLHRSAYAPKPLRSMKLLEASLATLAVSPEGSVAWMTVPEDAFRRLRALPEDLEGLIDYPRSVEGVEVGLLFRRARDGDVKVSFRANGEVDMNALARRFGGGGHRKAAGAKIAEPLEDALFRVVEAARDAVALAERNDGPGEGVS